LLASPTPTRMGQALRTQMVQSLTSHKTHRTPAPKNVTVLSSPSCRPCPHHTLNRSPRLISTAGATPHTHHRPNRFDAALRRLFFSPRPPAATPVVRSRHEYGCSLTAGSRSLSHPPGRNPLCGRYSAALQPFPQASAWTTAHPFPVLVYTRPDTKLSPKLHN